MVKVLITTMDGELLEQLVVVSVANRNGVAPQALAQLVTATIEDNYETMESA